MAEYGTHWVGIRDCCREVKSFLTEAERAEYENDPHPHGEEGEPEVKPEPTDRYSQDREAAGL